MYTFDTGVRRGFHVVFHKKRAPVWKGLPMQKKKPITTILILTAAIVAALAVTALAASYDSSEDPLISLSYLTETFRPSIEKDYKERIAALEEKLEKLSASSGNTETQEPTPATPTTDTTTTDGGMPGYTVVELKYGDCLFASDACDIMLRAGSAFCIAPDPSQGISDYTAGVELLNKDPLTKNHMCLIPRGDGRGIMATAQSVYVMVRGEYTIDKAE